MTLLRQTLQSCKSPQERSPGVSSQQPIRCGSCTTTFTSIRLLRNHVTRRQHTLPSPFLEKDEWLHTLLATERYQVGPEETGMGTHTLHHPHPQSYMSSIRDVKATSAEGTANRLRCYTDWLLVNGHLNFSPTDRPQYYDILVDEWMVTTYSKIYGSSSTKLSCEGAFGTMHEFFTRLATQLPTAPPLPGDHHLQLSDALRKRLREPLPDDNVLMKRRRSTLGKQLLKERMDEDVVAAKRARQPPGLYRAAADSDYDTLLLLTLLHMGMGAYYHKGDAVPDSIISTDCVELLELVFCVIFQITYSQRPEVLRTLVVGKHVKEVELWNVNINLGHTFKTGRHCQSLNLNLKHQAGVLASMLIRFGQPSKCEMKKYHTSDHRFTQAFSGSPPGYLISNTAGVPYTASTFAARFKSVSLLHSLPYVPYHLPSGLTLCVVQFTAANVSHLPYTPSVVSPPPPPPPIHHTSVCVLLLCLHPPTPPPHLSAAPCGLR